MPSTAGLKLLDLLYGRGRLTVGDLILLFWRWRWIFSLIVAATVGATVVWVLVVTPTYRVLITVMPRQGDNMGAGLQSLLSQFGGLASLAGAPINASVDEQEAIAWLKSRALTQRFIETRGLLPTLFPEKWDGERNTWRSGLKRTPTMDEAWAVFDRQIRRVSQDTRTRIVAVEIVWRDRQQAASWANELVAQANEELRARALHEADASLELLRAQLEQIDTVGLRQSIYRLMEVQLNRKVLANSRPDYAFAVLDPAVVPDADRIAAPRRRLLVMISAPLGVFAAACVVIALQLATEVVRSRRDPSGRSA